MKPFQPEGPGEPPGFQPLWGTREWIRTRVQMGPEAVRSTSSHTERPRPAVAGTSATHTQATRAGWQVFLAGAMAPSGLPGGFQSPGIQP